MLRLTLEREKRGWTKFQLATKASVHPSVIGQLEAEKLHPYPSYVEKLAEVFNIPGEELFKEVSK